MDYGAANKYDFDNPEKWHTVPSVPLLDEHEMTDDNGNVIAQVDKAYLEEVARNNQRKIYETGDPATIILGHTSDHPNAPEKPAQGFIVNPIVKPFKRNQDGQIIYAIHGDYKIRHNKKHLIEQYPRRSVELWHSKKDIDPVALLGGSSPERELGVLIRNARINHVSMDVINPSKSAIRVNSGETDPFREGVVRFFTRGRYAIETYYIEDHIPTHKYAKRRSTHKESIMPKNRKPIRNGRPNKYAADEHEMPVGSRGVPPNKKIPMEMQEVDEGPDEMDEGVDANNMGHNGSAGLDDAGYGEGPERYDEDDMGGNTDDDFDGGEEAIPGEEGDDQDENDPVLAKVFQSKQWNEMNSGIGQIKQMLQQMMGGGQEEQGMDGGMGDEGGSEEMPPPDTGMGGDMSGGQEPPMDGDNPGMPEEEDQRSMHGQKPVKMGMNTGMPGPTNTFIPGMNKKTPSKMSRGTTMPRPVVRNPKEDKRDRIIRDLRIQLSRAKAKEDIQQLEGEGVLFGPTPEVADKIKYARMEELTLAYLHDEDSGDKGEADTYVADKIEEMRVCYSRRRPDPVRRNTPNQASVARYGRTQADVTGQTAPESNDDDFEDKLGAIGSFEAINEFATLQAGSKAMSRQEAIKYSRKKYGIR